MHSRFGDGVWWSEEAEGEERERGKRRVALFHTSHTSTHSYIHVRMKAVRVIEFWFHEGAASWLGQRGANRDGLVDMAPIKSSHDPMLKSPSQTHYIFLAARRDFSQCDG